MNDQVDLSLVSGCERTVVVGQEIVTATSPHYAWSYGQVESNVRIGQQQYADGLRHAARYEFPGADR